MKLTYHYIMESKGKETPTARLLKATPFTRKWYYSNARHSARDPAFPQKLERIDHEARDVKLLCPSKCAPVFRKFLAESDTIRHVDERARLVRQMVLQLKQPPAFDVCSFSVKDSLRSQLDELSASIWSVKPERLARVHAHILFMSETKNGLVPLPLIAPMVPHDDFVNARIESNTLMIERPITTWNGFTIALSAIPPDVSMESWDAGVKRARLFRAMWVGAIGVISISAKVLATAGIIAYGIHPLHKSTTHLSAHLPKVEYELLKLENLHRTISSGTQQASLQ